MSKKASYKPDLSYHNDYDIVDQFTEDGYGENYGDTEYIDWCSQCGLKQLGYIDPSSKIFYCNGCWNAFSNTMTIQQPQQPQQTKPKPKPQPQPKPKPQSQQQPTQQQSQTQPQTQSNKLSKSAKKRRRKKNKNNQDKNQDKKQNNNIKSPPKPQPKPQPQSQPLNKNKNKNKNKNNKNKNNTNNNKNSKKLIKSVDIPPKEKKENQANSLLNRPSIFGDNDNKQKNTKNSLLSRPSLFGDDDNNNDDNDNSLLNRPRPSLFGDDNDDDDDNQTKNTPKKSNSLLNRPSLFGDDNGDKDNDNDNDNNDYLLNRNTLFDGLNDNQQVTPNIQSTLATNVNDNDNDIIAPNPYISDIKTKSFKNKKKIKKNVPNIIRRPFIGKKMQSIAVFKKIELKKKELIDLRFGLNTNDNKIKKKKKKKIKSEIKPHINLVIIGHVDAGKSTLMGRLLSESGVVNNRQLHKHKKDAAAMGKSSFAYAWVLDCHNEERKRGITVDVSTNYFETQNRCITLLDSPGHRDFIPKMISGTSQADAAILVVSAKIGEFETGFDINNGRTREHAIIAKSLGITQIIVAINKMDCINWDKIRYKFIVDQILNFLIEIGFRRNKANSTKKNIKFLPVSGIIGNNLIKDNDLDDNKWYKLNDFSDLYNTNLSLFECINLLRPSSTIYNDSLNGELRISITDIYKELNIGIIVTGKILSGSIISSQQILIQPLNLITSIKSLMSIENHSKNYKYNIAIKGDNVQLLLDIRDNNDEIFSQIKIGDFITSPHNPLKLINKFKSKIVTMKNLKIPICRGHNVLIHTHSIKKPAYIAKINNILNKKTLKVVKSKNIRHIKADQCAIVTIKLKNKNDIILLDKFDNIQEMSRITIRRDGETCALGLVEEI